MKIDKAQLSKNTDGSIEQQRYVGTWPAKVCAKPVPRQEQYNAWNEKYCETYLLAIGYNWRRVSSGDSLTWMAIDWKVPIKIRFVIDKKTL